MKYPENIQKVSSLLPDYMGFIFYEKSERHFEGILPEISETVQKVGVFVNPTLEEILEKTKKYNLHAVQLHGNESPEFCQLVKCLNVTIIKVFSVDAAFDFQKVLPYENVCDYFLFDTKGKFPGGNGKTFDWQLLQKYPSQKPIFLSGGIGPEEIEKIKKLPFAVYAVDLNSKFETRPGMKNTEQLKQLFYELQCR